MAWTWDSPVLHCRATGNGGAFTGGSRETLGSRSTLLPASRWLLTLFGDGPRRWRRGSALPVLGAGRRIDHVAGLGRHALGGVQELPAHRADHLLGRLAEAVADSVQGGVDLVLDDRGRDGLHGLAGLLSEDLG